MLIVNKIDPLSANKIDPLLYEQIKNYKTKSDGLTYIIY